MNLPAIQEMHQRSKTQRKGYELILDFLANYIAKLALLLKINPTQLTFFWVIFQFFTPLLFLTGKYAYFVLAVILFQFMFIVDLSDGKLFRFQVSHEKKKKPLFPKYLDRLGHFINNPFLFICLGLGTSIRAGHPLYLYLGFAAAVFFLLNKAITINPAWYKSEEERAVIVHAFKETIPRSGTVLPRFPVKQFIFDFLRVEHLGNLLFWGILLDLPHYILALYAGFFLLEFLRKLLAQGMFLWKEDNS